MPKFSKLQSLLGGTQAGTTLGFNDEIGGVAGALGAKYGGDTRPLRELYTEARDDNRAEHKAMQDENPNSYMAGNVGGSLVPGMLVPGVAGASMLGAGGAVGAADGKLTDPNTIKKAALGALISGGGAYAGGKLIKGLSDKYNPNYQLGKGQWGEVAETGMSPVNKTPVANVNPLEAIESQAASKFNRLKNLLKRSDKGIENPIERQAMAKSYTSQIQPLEELGISASEIEGYMARDPEAIRTFERLLKEAEYSQFGDDITKTIDMDAVTIPSGTALKKAI